MNESNKPETIVAASAVDAIIGGLARNAEGALIMGMYRATHRNAAGTILSEEDFPNLVTDIGAKLLLDTILAGSAFTAATYMGLKGTGAAAVADTQASHAGWLEVGAANVPLYTSPRKTIAWSAASGTGAGARTKASSGTFTFAFITTGGTVDGAFLNINGTSAIDNTTGTLFSAGTFSGGSKVVAVSDTLTVTYSLAI
jgi:hypothetical protein